MFGCTSGTADCSAARTSQIKMAETANETASIRIVTGAVKSCTNHPATASPLNSATDALAESLLFPSIKAVSYNGMASLFTRFLGIVYKQEVGTWPKIGNMDTLRRRTQVG
jgi:hypothetical protein